ncbi:MAG: MFS transporter [Planctomycetes bacterium]|nr:MFS transporter [Planctomycetota bacterium]
MDDDRYNVRMLTVTSWAGLFVFAIASTLLSVSLKPMGEEFGIGFAARGALGPIRAGSLAVFCLLAGWAADRVGKKWPLAVGMAATALSLVWISASPTFALFTCGIVFLAVGFGVMEALVSPLVAELHPRDVALHLNLLHAFYPAGIVVSSLLVGWLLSKGLRWRGPFLFAAVPALLVGLLFVAARYPGRGASQAASPLGVRQILALPAFWWLALAMLFGAGCEGGLFYWIPNFVQDEYDVSPMVGATGLTVFSAALMVGRFGFAELSRVLTQKQILVGLSVVGCAASLVFALAPVLWMTLIQAGVLGLCVSAFWPGLLSLAARHIAVGSATLFAMLSVAGIVGFGVTPFLIGAVAQGFGLRAGLCVMPVAFVGTALALCAVFRLWAARGESRP